MVWLIEPVQWHSSRVPDYNYTGMTDAEIALLGAKWHDWYTADWDFGQTTLIFFCVGIGLVSILNIALHLRSRSLARGSRLAIVDRAVAYARFFVARQYRIKFFRWYSPPLSAIIALSGIFIFVMGIMLSVRPYYWPNPDMGYSPPIATRSGWISIAIMPFMIIFATKANWIAMITGTSHEKLQVYHRWTAFFMYITALVHAFPFIVEDMQMGDMREEFTDYSFYWTGVIATVCQTYLMCLSWGYFRNTHYELFKKLHFLAAGIFMVALFIHCNFSLSSWDYFWATLGLYGSSWLFRIFRTLYNGPFGNTASVELLSNSLVRVSIATPKRVKWKPGQHVFVRFLNLGMHYFSSHPFTIESLPEDGSKCNLVFCTKGGITAALAKRAQGKTSYNLRVMVDGPYGGIHVALKDYDRVVLMAGGTGITFTLPLLRSLVGDMKTGKVKCKHVVFVLAVRERESYAWVEKYLVNIIESMAMGTFALKYHVTQETDSKALIEEDIDTLEVHNGRPDLAGVVYEEARSSEGRIAVVACGPDSFVYDIRLAVAEEQRIIADGYGKCQDLFLHTENYSC